MDFTTTAVIRPEIIDSTYKSFNENLLGINLKKCTLQPIVWEVLLCDPSW